MQINDKTKKILRVGAVLAACAWAAIITSQACAPTGKARGVASGGGMVLTGGGGISKVTANDPLTGSGTSSNHLGLSLNVDSPLSGTGSSGSHLTSSGDISAVTAGSGLTGGASSGAATLDVGAGSGIVVAADTVSTNAGSGLTYSSGALITNAGSGITYSSGALIANLGAQMTFSAGAIQPALTGGTCSNGQAYTSLSSVGAGTCGNTGRNAYGGTHFSWSYECISGLTTPQSEWFSITNSGTSSLITTGVTFATTRPGICEFTPGSTVNKLAMLKTAVGLDFAQASYTLEATVGWPTLSNSTDTYQTIVGFGDLNSTVNQTNGCYFLYDSENVATNGGNAGKAQDLECVCANNTGSPVRVMYLMDGSTVSDESFTTVAAPVAALTLPNTNIYRLKVTMTGTTRAEFYVDSGSGYTKRCDINTHISGGATHYTGMAISHISSAGALKVMDMDEVTMSIDLNAARSP